jgi:outer membrane biosynthesis protein TonB
MMTLEADYFKKTVLFFISKSLVVALLFFLAAPIMIGGDPLAAPAGTVDKELADAKSLFQKGKLQDAREALARAQQHMEGLSGTAASTYGSKMQKLSASITAFEDSLVKVNLDILRRHGADSAFQYMQDVVWTYGVSKEKLDLIENTILNEAPAVNEAQERDDVAYALKLLESNQPMDPSIDPYIVKTAKMILLARADSLKKEQMAGTEQSTPAVEAVETPQAATQSAAQRAETAPEASIPQPAAEQPATAGEPPQTTAAPEPQEPVVEPAVEAEPAVEPKPAEPARVATAITPEPRRTRPADKPKKPEEYTSPALLARAQATKEYLKKLKANQVTAQKNVVELYDMIESGQGPEAMKMFRDRRPFISKYISPQVFNVLELTLAQTIIDAQKGTSAALSRPASPSSPEEQIIKRIDGFMRQNKVEAAYREFSREEQTLKKYMPKKDFKLLKNMVEDAYKLRTGADVKKKK